jgi:hypothetical protein
VIVRGCSSPTPHAFTPAWSASESRFRGTGIAGRIIEGVIAAAREVPRTSVVSLTREDPAKPPFCHRRGFGEVAHARVDCRRETSRLTLPLDIPRDGACRERQTSSTPVRSVMGWTARLHEFGIR